MKKLAISLILLLILAMIIATAFTLILSGHKAANVPADGLKEGVMGIALNDPAVRRAINESNEEARIEYIKPGDAGRYVKDRERYAGVSVGASAGGEPIRFTVIVDTSTMREMSMQYSGLPPLTSSWVIIPPGNGIYEMLGSMVELSSGMRYAQPEISSGASLMELTPNTSRLYPLILDEDNFTSYMNGSAYEAADLIDPQSHDVIKVDGTSPVSSGWKAFYVLPEHRQPDGTYGADKKWYYLILLNRGDEEIKIVYKHPLMPNLYD